jgi:Ca-activated chloride channel family protein
MLSRALRLACLTASVLVASALPAGAQGLIVDRRGHVPLNRAYEIREVTIDARVREQVADVQVSQTFYNPGSTVIESEYLFPLPEEGAIQNFVLLVDGREMPGRILPKDEARRIYEDIVRTKRDPALLEYMGRGMFRTSVFPIPPGAERKVTLRYTQLLKRERDVVEFIYPLSTQRFTAKPIQRLSLTARIESKEAIKSLYSPVYDAAIRRDGEHEAKVELTMRDAVPSSDFKLVYTLAEGSIGATVLSYRPSDGDDGFFLLLASPQVKPSDEKPRPKSVVFVLDRSGSMAGKKIEQAKNALGSVLNNLREDDTFNIVAYDDRVESFKPELQRYNSSTRDEAIRFVSNIREGGSTNINDALKTALGMLQDDSKPNYVIFLTDGLPTAGETAEMRIAENAKQANRVRARVFVFGVGFDVNARLLDRLSGGNSGTSEYVRPDEDIERHVGAFYAKMTRPVLSNIAIDLAGTDVNRTYPRDIPDLFEGGQIVWVGRYRQSGRTNVKLAGKVGGERRTLEFTADLASSGRGSSYDFVERLWAIRRVGSIIDQIDMNGQNRELTDELVSLSRKYGILTPYTSFLADERVNLHADATNWGFARDNLSQLAEVQGQLGVAQRGAKQSYMNAEKPMQSYERLAGEDEVRLRSSLAAASPAAPAGATSAGGPPQVLARDRRGMGMGGGMARMGGMGGGMGGMGGRMMGRAEAKAEGFAANVRQVGGKTFYRKAERWVDSEVKPEDDAKAKTVEQFSDEFFKIARAQSAEMNQYMAFDEPVTVNLAGQVYRFDPPKGQGNTR